MVGYPFQSGAIITQARGGLAPTEGAVCEVFMKT